MSERPTEMQVRIAAAETLPVETDAPENTNPVPYDPGLQNDLIEHGPGALREYGQIVVRDVGEPARYNTAVWYALSHEPTLHYELKDGCVLITDPLAV